MAQPPRTPRNGGSGPERSDGGSSSSGSSGPRLSFWILLLAAVALVTHLLIFWDPGPSTSIEYSVFLDHVEDGHVAEVTVIDDRRIEGTYTAEAVTSGAVEVPADDAQGGGPSIFGEPTGEERRRFTTTKPDDHELTQFLRDYNAAAEADDADALAPVQFDARRDTNWLGGALTWLIPIGILVAFWIFFLRRMNPGSQVLNIGKNKAKLFDASEDHNVTFDDVAGLDEAKEEVSEIVSFLKSPDRFTRLGGKLPKGVLLVGPPGTGKTLMAKAVAGEAGVPFFSISGSDFVEMFVGVGASRVRDLFKNAKEKAPCIIFIDEMDAIGRSRGRNSMIGGNDERENTLNQLLVEMDGFDSDKGVIIMAATNRPDVLDKALLRPGRFDRQILVDKPDRPARKAILDVHTRDLLVGDDVDTEVLAGQTPGFAGAELANVCNEAALLAARKDKDAIGMDDFEQAIDRVIAGLEKKNKLIRPDEREVIAFHESGHAIVGWFLENTDPVVKVSIVPRGLSALGYAQYLPEERYLYTTEALKDRMAMAIAGRVAEEIVFGRVTTGAQNDLERITNMAYAMVVDYGMSDRVGQVSFNLSGRSEEPSFHKPYSDATAQAIDEEVRAIIEEARERARTLLEGRRDMLDRMAEALLDKEVLGPAELVELLGERPHGSYVSAEGLIHGAGSTGDGAVTDPEALPGESIAGGEDAVRGDAPGAEPHDTPAGPADTPGGGPQATDGTLRE